MRIQVAKLTDHRTTHGVSHQRGLLNALGIQERGSRVCKLGYGERFDGISAPAESGQVGHQGMKLIGEYFSGGQQIAAREPKSMEVQHHWRIRRGGRLTIEDIDAVDRRPTLS